MTFQKDPEQNETKFLRSFADLTGRSVLEIGSGEGRLTWRYAEGTGSTVAIDTDKSALRVAIIDRPSNLKDRVHFSNARAEHLPFSSETFDLALLAWSF